MPCRRTGHRPPLTQWRKLLTSSWQMSCPPRKPCESRHAANTDCATGWLRLWCMFHESWPLPHAHCLAGRMHQRYRTGLPLDHRKNARAHSLGTQESGCCVWFRSPPFRIQKKWKWEGQLFMDVSRDKAERVCDIILNDASNHPPTGLRFAICLRPTQESLRFSAFYDLHHLPMFLEACAPSQQIAKVTPKEDKDIRAVQQLGTFMQKRALVNRFACETI